MGLANILMKAPAGVTGTVILQDGSSATIDSQGCVSVNPANVAGLMSVGFRPMTTAEVLPDTLYTDMADTAAAAVTVASLLAKDATIDMAGTLTAGATLTLPTVTDLLAGLEAPYDGMSIKVRVLNSGAGNFAWTLTANTGWTLAQTMTVAQNTWRDFYVKITSVANKTATFTARGAGTL